MGNLKSVYNMRPRKRVSRSKEIGMAILFTAVTTTLSVGTGLEALKAYHSNRSFTEVVKQDYQGLKNLTYDTTKKLINYFK